MLEAGRSAWPSNTKLYWGRQQISKYKCGPQPNLTAPYIQTDRQLFGESSRLDLLL